MILTNSYTNGIPSRIVMLVMQRTGIVLTVVEYGYRGERTYVWWPVKGYSRKEGT